MQPDVQLTAWNVTKEKLHQIYFPEKKLHQIYFPETYLKLLTTSIISVGQLRSASR